MSFPKLTNPDTADKILSSEFGLGTDTPASVSTIASSSPEKGHLWDGYLEDPMPEKTHGKWIRNLRFQVFSLYRRLFSIVFPANLAVFIATVVQGGSKLKTNHIGKIVVANIFCAILMRQDHVINGFFKVFTSVPRSWPMWIRRVCARVYAIGGLHSGCGVSGLVWLVLFTVQATKETLAARKIADIASRTGASMSTLILTYIIFLLLVVIVIFALPNIRKRAHNNFEAIHRFLGWSAIGLVWGQVILLTNDYKQPDQFLRHALVANPSFWLVVIMTASIILPWARLQKVPVVPEVLSSHAIRLHFGYVTPGAGSFTRISDSPLTEWHSFATIPEPQKSGYSLIVSRAGDWTSKIIENPPRELWVRGVPTFGCQYCANVPPNCTSCDWEWYCSMHAGCS
jgi:hypothetical protein